MSVTYYCGGCGAEMPGGHKDYCYRLTTSAHIFEPATPPLPSALAGVTPEELRSLANGMEPVILDGLPNFAIERGRRIQAILRALADSIEKTEGKP